jgi:hypothetical protein
VRNDIPPPVIDVLINLLWASSNNFNRGLEEFSDTELKEAGDWIWRQVTGFVDSANESNKRVAPRRKPHAK